MQLEKVFLRNSLKLIANFNHMNDELRTKIRILAKVAEVEDTNCFSIRAQPSARIIDPPASGGSRTKP
jgi:hypothetical protein